MRAVGSGDSKRVVRVMVACSDVRGARRLPANPQLPRPARQAISRHIYFAVVGRASARIRLSLKINISLIIGEIYKIIEDFLTQFSPLYLSMKYLAIISRYFVYTLCTVVCTVSRWYNFWTFRADWRQLCSSDMCVRKFSVWAEVRVVVGVDSKELM